MLSDSDAEFLNHFGADRSKSNGSGGFMAKCTAHPDTNHSLSCTPASASRNGNHMVTCHAGCKFEEILEAADLKPSDLFPSRPERQRALRELRKAQKQTTPNYDNLPPKPKKPAITTTHKFYDPDSAGGFRHVATKTHISKADGTKDGPWSLPDGTKGLGGRKTETLLYGRELVPEEQTTILWVEGERKADKLQKLGWLAASGAGGSGKPPSVETLRALAGHDIVVIPDCDEAGEKHAKEVCSRLIEAGAASVNIARIKNPKFRGYDIADLIEESSRDGLTESEIWSSISAAELFTSKTVFGFETLSEARTRRIKKLWTVKKLIEMGVMGALVGASGVAKTFIAVNLVSCIATGTAFIGHDTKQGACFYFAGEGLANLPARFNAWEVDRGIKISDDKLFISTMRIELDDSGAANLETAMVRKIEETGVVPALLVIDPLARCFPSDADENNSGDIMNFLNRLGDMAARIGCGVLILHHVGHGEKQRGRGSSAFRAAMDYEILLERDGEKRILSFTKMKDGAEPHPQAFVLEQIELDERDEDDEPITSAVILWTGESSRQTKLTKNENIAVEALRAVTVKIGELSAAEDDWREEFHRLHGGKPLNTKNKAFGRARKDLTSKKIIVVDNEENYRLVSKTLESISDPWRRARLRAVNSST